MAEIIDPELLKEYVATANNPKYNSNWDIINGKFPEFKSVDKDLLKEYVATANNPKYNSDWNVINSKFPEFQSDLKKKEPASSAVPNLLKPLPQSGEQPKAGFPTSPSEAMKASTQLESTGKQKQKTNLDYLKDINNTYKERIATSQERVNAKRELMQLQPQIEGAYSQLQQLQNVYQDPNVPIDQKKQAFNSYNTLLTQIEPIRSRYDELSSKYNDLVKQDKQQVAKLKDLDNQRKLHLKGEFSISKDFIEKTGRGFIDAAAGVAGIFNTLGLSGDPENPEIRSEVKQQTRENIDKMRAFGESLVTQEAPKEWNNFFKGKMSPRKLLYATSQAVSSTVPTVAAGLFTGGVGTVVAGAGMGFNESKDILKEAGLNDSQAEWASLGLSIPLGLLEEYGAEDVVKIIGSPFIKKKVAAELVKSLAGKKITKELLFNESRKSLGKVIAENAGGILTTGLKESGTEVTQGTLQEIAKQTAQEYTGVNPDDEVPFSEYAKGFVKQRAEEAAGGFLGGTTLYGAGKGIESVLRGFKSEFTPSVYSQVKEFKDPEKFQEFQEDLKNDVDQGLITPEQAQETLQNVQAISEADALIPSAISDNDLRAEAVNLIIEKKKIEKDIEGKDKSLITPLLERIKEIDKRLVGMSKGEIVDESQQEEQDASTSDEEVERPIGETPEAAPAQPQAPSEKVSAATTSNAIYVKDGEQGIIKTEGQSVVFETNDKIIELGNKDEIGDKPLSEFGIEKEEPLNLEIGEDNSVVIDGDRFVNNYSNPAAAINTDADGNVVSVNLETEDGKKRTFRGQRAQEIAYQYKLKEFEQNATEESIARLEQEVTSLEGKNEQAKSKTKERSTAKGGKQQVKPTPKPAEGYKGSLSSKDYDQGYGGETVEAVTGGDYYKNVIAAAKAEGISADQVIKDLARSRALDGLETREDLEAVDRQIKQDLATEAKPAAAPEVEPIDEFIDANYQQIMADLKLKNRLTTSGCGY